MSRAFSGTIPVSAEAIDARWMEAALAPVFPGVRVRSLELERRVEVTNAHARFRIEADGAPGMPERLFVKMLPSEPGHREAIRATQMGLREALFYERLAGETPLRVPRALVARADEASGDFVIVMEDLDAAGCAVSDGPRSATVDQASRALEELAAWHVRFEDPAVRRSCAGWVPRPDPPSEYGVVRLKIGLEQHRARLSDAFAELAALYIEEQGALHALWHPGTGPTTVVHGDPHVGNLFWDGDRLGFLDWGLIVASSPFRDVSYFLQMALSVADRRASERSLLRHYLEARRARRGRAIGEDEAWQAHRIQAAYLAPACCQIVTFPEDASPRRQRFAAAFLSRAQAAIEDLEAAQAVRERL